MQHKRTFRKEDSPKTFMSVVCGNLLLAILVGLGGGIGMITEVFRNYTNPLHHLNAFGLMFRQKLNRRFVLAA